MPLSPTTAHFSPRSRVKFTPESFTHEMNDMLDLLHGEPMKKSYESFIYPVFVMNALMRAQDGWEPIHPIVL